MGTRNLTMVISEGKTKVAQYGQWDGYPEVQGKTILQFLKECDLKLFKERLKKLSFISSKKVGKLWSECLIINGQSWNKFKTSELFKTKYPELSRDTGAKVLQLIYEGKVFKLLDNSKFIHDSLWCEWVYVIDLDKNRFEVYTNFSQNPLTKKDRFFTVKYKKDAYYPIKIVKSYSIKKLPTVRQFIKDTTFESHKDLEELGYNIIINHKFKQ
ncbi:MAG: hypothetical protein HXX18_12040 [Bacteroidetes bacterium]|nr:hypothetical protein [Bacteroidota bacterium]